MTFVGNRVRKTTTLVARAAWLLATGTPSEAIRATIFNKRAAAEMTERLDAAVVPAGVASGSDARRAVTG
jgi:UvrD/REP helicase.